MQTATSIVDPEQVAATLEAAADYIDTNGWCQHHSIEAPSRGEESAGCLLYAIGITPKAAQFATLYPAMNKALYGEVGYISIWNDEPGREEWEVTELLRSTAKKVRHGDIELGDK